MIETLQEFYFSHTFNLTYTMENLLSLLYCHYYLLTLFQSKYQVTFWSVLRHIWVPVSKFCLTVSHYVMFSVQVYGNSSQLPEHPGKASSIYIL